MPGGQEDNSTRGEGDEREECKQARKGPMGRYFPAPGDGGYVGQRSPLVKSIY